MVTNGGYFNPLTQQCLGNVVSGGAIVQVIKIFMRVCTYSFKQSSIHSFIYGHILLHHFHLTTHLCNTLDSSSPCTFSQTHTIHPVTIISIPSQPPLLNLHFSTSTFFFRPATVTMSISVYEEAFSLLVMSMVLLKTIL